MQLRSHYWNERVCRTEIESLEEKYFHRMKYVYSDALQRLEMSTEPKFRVAAVAMILAYVR